jgi:hypothetical protein
MTSDDPKTKPFSLKRWSQRKLESASAAPSEPVAAPAAVPSDQHVAPVPVPPAPTADAAPLPSIESLTIDSDFTRFMGPKVDAQLKRQALKQLFRDPRFNVMDGLDVYIDDYSQPDPISPELVREMVQGRYIFDPPKTRVNEQGIVEDVPPEEVDANADAAGESTGAAVLPDASTPGPAAGSAPLVAPEGLTTPEHPSVPPQEPEPAR